jgi:nicotinamide-nucleotide amidase
MKAAILTIGDEILIGQITDTNSGYIAKSLDGIGVEVAQMLSIGDDKNIILKTFQYLQNQVDLVIITGGLGPTKDDITKKTFTEYFNDELVVNQEVLAHVIQMIEKIYNRPASQINKDQALVPSKCEVLFNDFGTAPGIWMQKEQTIFISLPGVPYEMTHLMSERVIPNLIKKYKHPYRIHKTIITHGVGESLLAEQIEDWENSLPEYIKLAYLPSPGRVRLRLSAKGSDKEHLLHVLETKTKDLIALIGDVIIGFEDDEPIEVVVGKKLIQRGETLATAESCTGGLLAAKLVAIAGASAYYQGSVVAYTQTLKTELLQVKPETIIQNTVVSVQVAEEMAVGVKNKLKTTYGIGITGNAGPTSSTNIDDIGVVCIAIATPKEVISARFEFGKPREKVLNRTTNKALEMLLKIVSKN